MRQETITYDIYTFNELDKSAKEKALEQVREKHIIHDVYEFMLPDTAENIAYELQALGFNDCEVYYGCSYCKGSGATIDFSSLDPEKLTYRAIKNAGLSEDIKQYLQNIRQELKPLLAYKGEYLLDIGQRKNSYANLYCHDKTRYVSIEYDNESKRDSVRDKYHQLVYRDGGIEDGLTEFTQGIGRAIYRELCDEIEYYWNDDNVIEYIEEHGAIEFNQDGSLY